MESRMNKIVRTIHADVSETIEIHWHKPKADVHVLIERHTAPPDEVWKMRAAEQTPEAK